MLDKIARDFDRIKQEPLPFSLMMIKVCESEASEIKFRYLELPCNATQPTKPYQNFIFGDLFYSVLANVGVAGTIHRQ